MDLYIVVFKFIRIQPDIQLQITPFKACADPESFVRRGPTFFFLIRGEKTQRLEIPLKAGHHRPASETPFKCWLGSFLIFQGIWTSIAKKP